MSGRAGADDAPRRPRPTPQPAVPVRRIRGSRRRGSGAGVSALVIVAVGVVALVVLTLRPSPTSRTQHFVRTFSDTAGYAETLHTPSAKVSAPAAGARVLTMKGGWTSAIGEAIARRALRWVGTPYSFAGGNAQGPTLGTPVDHDSRNDGHIVGFDCSGLVIFALAPYLSVTHYAAAQYVEAGAVHPTLDQLLPGDLVFWSSDGTIKGVGHVAVYVGGGKVVQAPESGEDVRVTPLNQVEPGAIGTTRPLTTL